VTEEERRALLFREQSRTRARFRASLCAGLAGDVTAAAAVTDAFAPLLPDPLDGWDCPDLPAPARPAWAARVPGSVELPNYLK
jgi:hypothetical protein